MKFIKNRKIAWLGQTKQMYDDRVTKRIMQWGPTGKGIRGRRWIEDVEQDIQTMGIGGWIVSESTSIIMYSINMLMQIYP